MLCVNFLYFIVTYKVLEYFYVLKKGRTERRFREPRNSSFRSEFSNFLLDRLVLKSIFLAV